MVRVSMGRSRESVGTGGDIDAPRPREGQAVGWRFFTGWAKKLHVGYRVRVVRRAGVGEGLVSSARSGAVGTL